MSLVPVMRGRGGVIAEPRPAYLCFNDYAGFRMAPVLVVGETPQRLRIEAVRDMRLAGRNRRLPAGETALVPKGAVRFAPLLDAWHEQVRLEAANEFLAAEAVQNQVRAAMRATGR